MSEESNPYQAPQTTAGSTETHSLVGVSVTTTMIEHLRKTRPWVRFISVLGFISIGLIGLAAVSMTLGVLFTGSLYEIGVMFIPGVLYVGALVIYFISTLHLHRYASSLKKLLAEGGIKALEDALGYQKSFWKLAGILAIVMVGLGVLLMVFTVIMGIAGRFG